MPKKLTPKFLKSKKVPQVLIAGLVLASVLGWTGWKGLEKVQNYYQLKSIFPSSTQAINVIDGDTFTIKNGLTVRLLGIDAPNRGAPGYQKSLTYLNSLISFTPSNSEGQKKIFLEYDTYQDDKYGRILAYVWIDCNDNVRIYCHENRALVNEIMLKSGFAKKVVYQDRKKLKYDDYLQFPQPPQKLTAKNSLGVTIFVP